MDESSTSAAASKEASSANVREADSALDNEGSAGDAPQDARPVTASFQAQNIKGGAAADEPILEEGPIAPMVRDRIGHVVAGRYRIVELLGEGGMGAVYRGEHITLHKRVAVKFLHPELSRQTEVVSRFQREAQAAAILEHPNVVAAHDFGRDDDGSFFLVMDFVDGATLGAVLDKEPRLSPARVLHIARHVGAALARAHEIGIVHRDLKPDNIVLVQRDGDEEFAKVIDFGIAKLNSHMTKGQSITQVGMVFGTPEYMAPEQALGAEVDNRADLYALAVVLFECLTGRRPFDAEDVVTLLGLQISEPVPKLLEVAPDLDVPPELDDFFAKALAKKPANRFATAGELVESLSNALGFTFTGLGPAAASRNPTLSNTGKHPAAITPASVTGQKLPAAPTPSGPIPAVTAADHPTPTTPPTIVPLSEIARQSLVVIPKAAAETIVGATRDAWEELSKDEAKKKKTKTILAGSFGLCALIAIGAGWSNSGRTHHRVPPVQNTIATNTGGGNTGAGIQNPPNGSHPPRVVPTPTNHAEPNGTNNGTGANGSVTAQPNPQNNGASPPPLPRPTGDLTADLAAFRAQPAIHVLLDPRGSMPLRARVEALEALRASGMTNPLMDFTLGGLYARLGPRGRPTMLDRYASALTARPELAADTQLIDDVIAAAESGRNANADRARTMLRGPLRGHAPQRLVARFPLARTKKDRERDIALLSADFASSIDATVLQLIEVFRARNCGQIKTAVDALAATGDARSVATLEAIPRAPRRCGWGSPCNPCLGDSVDRALAAVRARPAPRGW
ncbi:MAG: serine/threonine protein kinase [Myxococcales bacterium]|nr:serine/threonine protein kinase [Myxococcales bacterium]